MDKQIYIDQSNLITKSALGSNTHTNHKSEIVVYSFADPWTFGCIIKLKSINGMTITFLQTSLYSHKYMGWHSLSSAFWIS